MVVRQATSFVLLVAFALMATAVRADQSPLQAFFGAFEGRTRFPMGEQSNRYLRVSIRPHGNGGFTVAWETEILKSADVTIEKSMVVDFEPTERAGIYAAVDPPGGGPDPLGGGPYIWAQHADRTLTVHLFFVDDHGDYVVQSYARTLIEDGLALDFHRVRNGVTERRIKGTLKRLDEMPPPTGR